MSQPDGGGDPYFKNMADRACEDRDAWKRHAQTTDRELEQLREELRSAQRYPESLALLSEVATQMARDLAILAAGGHGTSEGLRKYVELGVVEVERDDA